MANKFNVFVYEIGESWAYIYHQCEGEYSILADFEDVNGNITSCRIVNLDFKSGSNEVLHIDDQEKERTMGFAEQLLEADEFYIEVRCKPYYLGDFSAIGKFADILSNMVGVDYENSGISINYVLRNTLRYVETRDASQEYWDEQKMKKLLSKLSDVSSEFETLCRESHVQQINLEGGKVDVSEVLAHLQTMRANIFGKLDSPEEATDSCLTRSC